MQHFRTIGLAAGALMIACVFAGSADQAIDEMWVERSNSFAATSCPVVRASLASGGCGDFPQMVQALLFAYERTDKPRYLEIGRRLMKHSRRVGMRTIPWWSKAYYYMDLIGRGKAEGKQIQ